jgi:branched-chain amino acid transport system permease protein
VKCINGLSNATDLERLDDDAVRPGPGGQNRARSTAGSGQARYQSNGGGEQGRGRRQAAALALRGGGLMDLLPLLPQALADGILLGGVYAIVAVGLTMTFGVLRIVNFAHGDFLAVGLYLTYIGAKLLGLDPYLSLVLVLPLVTLAAALTYKLLVAPVIREPEHNQIVVTLGLSLILQNGMLVFFTADLHAIPSVLSGQVVRIGNVFIQAAALIASAVSIALCLGLYWFLRSTELGRLIRASAQDRDAALLSGVNVDRMYLLAFCIGVGSLGLVAPLIAPFNYVSPSVGSNFTLTAFIVVVLGSMGNFAGALIGGFIIGIVEAVGGLMTGGSINFIITYAIFILFLLFKPEGLLGGRRL